MSVQFDAYEYTGVITPGAIAVFSASLVIPELKAYMTDGGITLGGLGIFLVLSFVTGHLLQGFGNLLENIIWWPYGGIPTYWVLKKKQQILNPHQQEKLFAAVAALYPGFDPAATNRRSEWYAVTRELYARIKASNAAERIDAFNRTYGLLRGVAASLIIVGVAGYIFDQVAWRWLFLIAIAAAVAIYRMYVFGIHYSRELFVTYLSLKESGPRNVSSRSRRNQVK